MIALLTLFYNYLISIYNNLFLDFLFWGLSCIIIIQGEWVIMDSLELAGLYNELLKKLGDIRRSL